MSMVFLRCRCREWSRRERVGRAAKYIFDSGRAQALAALGGCELLTYCTREASLENRLLVAWTK
jgi:hypothetical protein